jgi:hypothetical protein
VENARSPPHATVLTALIATALIATEPIRTPRRELVKTSRVRAVVAVAVAAVVAAGVGAVTKDAIVRCRANRMANTARTHVHLQSDWRQAQKLTRVLNAH